MWRHNSVGTEYYSFTTQAVIIYRGLLEFSIDDIDINKKARRKERE